MYVLGFYRRQRVCGTLFISWALFLSVYMMSAVLTGKLVCGPFFRSFLHFLHPGYTYSSNSNPPLESLTPTLPNIQAMKKKIPSQYHLPPPAPILALPPPNRTQPRHSIQALHPNTDSHRSHVTPSLLNTTAAPNPQTYPSSSVYPPHPHSHLPLPPRSLPQILLLPHAPSPQSHPPC